MMPDGLLGAVPEISVSDLVALLNQTFEYAYPEITVVGELANMRVSKDRWLYFDLKDEFSTVKFFGTVQALRGQPLENGMMLSVAAAPRLHNLYGFSMNVRSLKPVGEGSIKKAAELLATQLSAEGLFDPARKRPLAYPPRRIGLVASRQSAAYADFIKILGERFGGLFIDVIDVQVQGDPAPAQITAAIQALNALPEPPDVLVVIRGGGSAEDLAAFSTEEVTRAVAVSRIPTLVAIGHEIDLSLAELAADVRASTPSNAAELLVPDKRTMLRALAEMRSRLGQLLDQQVVGRQEQLAAARERLTEGWQSVYTAADVKLQLQRQVLAAYNPSAVLERGYAIVRAEQQLITSVAKITTGSALELQLRDGSLGVTVTAVRDRASQ